MSRLISQCICNQLEQCLHIQKGRLGSQKEVSLATRLMVSLAIRLTNQLDVVEMQCLTSILHSVAGSHCSHTPGNDTISTQSNYMDKAIGQSKWKCGKVQLLSFRFPPHYECQAAFFKQGVGCVYSAQLCLCPASPHRMLSSKPADWINYTWHDHEDHSVCCQLLPTND